jgi:hypothetical protein
VRFTAGPSSFRNAVASAAAGSCAQAPATRENARHSRFACTAAAAAVAPVAVLFGVFGCCALATFAARSTPTSQPAPDPGTPFTSEV